MQFHSRLSIPGALKLRNHRSNKEVFDMLQETEFLNGILLEDNPFADEVPASCQAFDLHGNEVSLDETE